MHHDEEYFPDPDDFRPSRWLEENTGRDLNDAFMPFGIGPRACVGRK